jgi:hypothetical protein
MRAAHHVMPRCHARALRAHHVMGSSDRGEPTPHPMMGSRGSKMSPPYHWMRRRYFFKVGGYDMMRWFLLTVTRVHTKMGSEHVARVTNTSGHEEKTATRR